MHETRVQATALAPETPPEPAPAAPADGLERVPLADLPGKPHPKAQRTLSKALNKTGVYKALVDTLNGVSFTVVCDDADVGWEVAKALGARLGWFPVATSRVLAGMHGLATPPPTSGTGGAGGGLVPVPVLVEALGSQEELARAEVKVLQGLRNQKRVIASTIPHAALASPETWREVFGSFIVWIDEVDTSSPKPKTPERQLLQRHAEVQVRLKKQRGFMAAPKTAQDKARTAVDALLNDLVGYLNANQTVIENKIKYVAYGCRGDWPALKPPEWSPVMDALNRPGPETAEAGSAEQPASS